MQNSVQLNLPTGTGTELGNRSTETKSDIDVVLFLNLFLKFWQVLSLMILLRCFGQKMLNLGYINNTVSFLVGRVLVGEVGVVVLQSHFYIKPNFLWLG